MDLDRFKELSAAFGAGRRRWPEREHALYDRLADTPEGMAILAEAGRTDGFLDALEPARPDPRRARRVGALAQSAWRRLAGPAVALAASAAVCFLGFIVGYLQARGPVDTGGVAQLLLGPQSLQEIGL
jgi:hypothetical protein